jgi:transposase-like protein
MQDEIQTDRERRAAVSRWRRSGMAAADFAPLVGVSAATLYAWSRRFPGVQRIGAQGRARLVELVPAPDLAARSAPQGAGDVHIALELRCGRTLRFPSHTPEDVLRRIVAAVESV